MSVYIVYLPDSVHLNYNAFKWILWIVPIVTSEDLTMTENNQNKLKYALINLYKFFLKKKIDSAIMKASLEDK